MDMVFWDAIVSPCVIPGESLLTEPLAPTTIPDAVSKAVIRAAESSVRSVFFTMPFFTWISALSKKINPTSLY